MLPVETVRDLLKRSLEDAEAVLKEHYGSAADRMLVAQVAVVAADIRLRLGEARLREAVKGPLTSRLERTPLIRDLTDGDDLLGKVGL